MKIQVNGKEIEIADGINVTTLLTQLGVVSGRVVVERNEEEIISRSKFDQTLIQDGDKLEVLNFVGGGES